MSSKCSKCTGPVNAKVRGIKCLVCEKCFHKKCLFLPETSFEAFYQDAKTTQVSTWLCEDCQDQVKELNTKNAALVAENLTLKKDNETLKTRLNSLEGQVNSLKADIICEVLNEIRSAPQLNTENPDHAMFQPISLSSSENMRKEIYSVMHEDREREKKKLNLCIRNFPESPNGQNELPKVKKFLEKNLGIQGTEISGISEIRRLGQPTADKARIMIVSCSNMDVRRNILKNASKLKSYRTPNDKRVFILPDMTKMQIEADKKLNDELWRRRNRGERVVIRRGRIISLEVSPPGSNE